MDRTILKAYWGYKQWVLASGEHAERGKLACLDTATAHVVVGKSAVGLLPIGVFDETKTGDGVKAINVNLFEELVGFWWDNDTTDAVDVTDVGKPCFVKDGSTVSMDGAGRSRAGVVLALDGAKGVLVHSTLAGITPT